MNKIKLSKDTQLNLDLMAIDDIKYEIIKIEEELIIINRQIDEVNSGQRKVNNPNWIHKIKFARDMKQITLKKMNFYLENKIKFDINEIMLQLLKFRVGDDVYNNIFEEAKEIDLLNRKMDYCYEQQFS